MNEIEKERKRLELIDDIHGALVDYNIALDEGDQAYAYCMLMWAKLELKNLESLEKS